MEPTEPTTCAISLNSSQQLAPQHGRLLKESPVLNTSSLVEVAVEPEDTELPTAVAVVVLVDTAQMRQARQVVAVPMQKRH
jgi:hypothetical protein